MMISRRGGAFVVWAIFLFAFPVVGATSQEQRSIDWETNLDSALARAGEENKPIFLVITGGIWCDSCNWFTENTLTDRELVTTVEENWVPLRLLDIDPSITQWNETTVPAVLLLSPKGDEITRIVGNNTAEVIRRRLTATQGDESPVLAQPGDRVETDLSGAIFRIGTGTIWNGDGGTWYTEDIGLPLELEEYDRDSAFLYLRDPKSATVIAITASPEEERYLWRWNRDANSWDEVGALRRIE
jgi:hypothetical protein